MTTKVTAHHRLPRVVMVPGLAQFKKCLGNALRSRVGFLGWPVQDQELDFHDPCASLPTQNTLGFYMSL